MTLRFLTAGESHGPGLTAILEGLPAGIPISENLIHAELKRRMLGYGRGGRMKIETDDVKIHGGVRHGKTLGSPLALWIENKDHRAWKEEMAPEEIPNFVSKKMVTQPRPGHTDLYGGLKYGHRDLRNILERASARETAARVAVGAVCQQFLRQFAMELTAHVTAIGDVKISTARPSFFEIKTRQENDPCRCIDADVSKKMIARIDAAKSQGDSVGGIFEVIATGLVPGLGSHVHWDRKLEGRLAQMILSIPAVKGVELGTGFEMATQPGSKVHDEIFYDEYAKRFFHKTNNAGGITGGITTGEDLVLRVALKPIATLYTPLQTVNIDSKKSHAASVERSDTCAVPAAAVIAQNVVAFVLADALLEKLGGDSLAECLERFEILKENLSEY